MNTVWACQSLAKNTKQKLGKCLTPKLELALFNLQWLNRGRQFFTQCLVCNSSQKYQQTKTHISYEYCLMKNVHYWLKCVEDALTLQSQTLRISESNLSSNSFILKSLKMCRKSKGQYLFSPLIRLVQDWCQHAVTVSGSVQQIEIWAGQCFNSQHKQPAYFPSGIYKWQSLPCTLEQWHCTIILYCNYVKPLPN